MKSNLNKMIKVKIYNQKADNIGEETLSDKVFGVKVKEDLVHQAMVTQMANERQVLAHTKGRSDVRGGGKKPWRQKGTGRARAGSSRSPIWIGGGVTFGPLKSRNFKKDINKKMKKKALCMVFSDRLSNDNLIIIDKIKVTEYKTKLFNDIIKNFEKSVLRPKEAKSEDKKVQSKNKVKRSILVLTDDKDDKIKYSGRNLVGVKLLNLENVNIIDLLNSKNIFITASGIKMIEERYK
jgi:large subunit ribosomal protein L4